MKKLLVILMLFSSGVVSGQHSQLERIKREKSDKINDVYFVNGANLTLDESMYLLELYRDTTIAATEEFKGFPASYVKEVYKRYHHLPKNEIVLIKKKARLSTKFYFDENHQIDLIEYTWLYSSKLLSERKKKAYVLSFIDFVSRNQPMYVPTEKNSYMNLIHVLNIKEQLKK